MAHDPKRPKDLLDWLKVSNAPDWRVARPMGPIIAVALGLLFALALLAAFLIVGAAIGTPQSAGFGTGAVIVALLGAPFLIWRTVIAQTTLGYQKEGHITDRINKAVEMLGAEKEVKYHLKNSKGKKRYKKDEHGKIDHASPVMVEETVPNIEVRMGAILSLERIAQDSTRFDKGRDHVRVMEILCAYIRENSNARTPAESPLPDWTLLPEEPSEEERAEQERWRTARFGGMVEMDEGHQFLAPNARDWARSLAPPRADVQLALAVIGRRGADQRRVEAAWPDPPTEATVWPFDPDFTRLADDPGEDPLSVEVINDFKLDLERWRQTISPEEYRGYRLDLRRANLQRADMAAKRPDGADAVFSGARLEGARMEGVDLKEARMEGANLRDVRMEGANLARARMEGAGLREARMEGTNLEDARLEGTNLGSAQLEGANLTDARMEGAALRGAQMDGADLERARLEGTCLAEARMGSTILVDVRLEGAVFWQARMDADTSLRDAALHGAAARDVDWRSVPISQGQVNSIFGDASVTLPVDITRPTRWADWRLPFVGNTEFFAQWRKWQADPDTYTPPDPPE